MQAGDHGNGEAGHANKVTCGRFVRDAHAIDPEGRPSPLCAGRPEVRSTVFQGAADDGGRDFVGALLPCARALPAPLLDEVVQRFADGLGVVSGAGRPLEVMRNVLAHGGDDDARPKLRHAEVRSVQKMPLGVVSQLLEAGLELLAVVLEHSAENAPDVLNHDRAGARDIDKVESGGEQVALVAVAKLLACYREGRAWESARQQFDALEGFCIVFDELAQVLREDLPFGPVEVEGIAVVLLNLDQPRVTESGLLQAERLPAAAGAKLQ